MPIALYSDAVKKLFQVNLDTSEEGATSRVLKQPVTLQRGTYRLAWASPAEHLRVWAFKIGCEERDVLNSGGECVVIGMGRGRQHYQLPAKLGEVQLPPERFGLVPQILLKG